MISQRQVLQLENFPRPEVARCLSPNGRAHPLARDRATKSVAERVKLEALRQGLRPMHGLVTLRVTCVYPVARKRDDDNAATGIVKNCRDALVRGGYLEADDVEHLRQEPVEIRVEPGVRRMVLELESDA